MQIVVGPGMDVTALRVDGWDIRPSLDATVDLQVPGRNLNILIFQPFDVLSPHSDRWIRRRLVAAVKKHGSIIAVSDARGRGLNTAQIAVNAAGAQLVLVRPRGALAATLQTLMQT